MVQAFATNVVGVTKKNDDSSSRQKILKKSRKQQTAELYRDSLNLHDRNAFAVFTSQGQIGYIPSEVAAQIAPDVDKGKARYVVSRLQIKEWENDGHPIWVAKISIESRSVKTGAQLYLKDFPVPISKSQKIDKFVGFGARMVLGATKLTWRGLKWGVLKIRQKRSSKDS